MNRQTEIMMRIASEFGFTPGKQKPNIDALGKRDAALCFAMMSLDSRQLRPLPLPAPRDQTAASEHGGEEGERGGQRHLRGCLRDCENLQLPDNNLGEAQSSQEI